ncbi:Hypothetical protein HDN1F_37710 [gamma proteobacterium HdN1]|nr:Hypothetical protein HDN1F_37710 [gamma proteobacterium HdN1]
MGPKIKFWLLLWVLGLRMAWLAWRSEKFRQLLVNKDLVLQLQTRDGGIVRHYTVKNERVYPSGGAHEKPSASVEFKDAEYAMMVLLGSGKNPMLFMTGMQKQDISVRGDASVLMWFMGVARHLPPERKKKKN